MSKSCLTENWKVEIEKKQFCLTVPWEAKTTNPMSSDQYIQSSVTVCLWNPVSNENCVAPSNSTRILKDTSKEKNIFCKPTSEVESDGIHTSRPNSKNLFFAQTKSGRICNTNQVKEPRVNRKHSYSYYRDKQKKLGDAENKIRSIVQMYFKIVVLLVIRKLCERGDGGVAQLWTLAEGVVIVWNETLSDIRGSWFLAWLCNHPNQEHSWKIGFKLVV